MPNTIAIDNTLISEDIIEKHFVCDLNSCKGACCIQGDSGAPLTKKEAQKLKKSINEIIPFITEKGAEEINRQGVSILDEEDLVTPLIKGKECAYAYFNKGAAKCGIEKAFDEKGIDF